MTRRLDEESVVRPLDWMGDALASPHRWIGKKKPRLTGRMNVWKGRSSKLCKARDVRAGLSISSHLIPSQHIANQSISSQACQSIDFTSAYRQSIDLISGPPISRSHSASTIIEIRPTSIHPPIHRQRFLTIRPTYNCGVFSNRRPLILFRYLLQNVGPIKVKTAKQMRGKQGR